MRQGLMNEDTHRWCMDVDREAQEGKECDRLLVEDEAKTGGLLQAKRTNIVRVLVWKASTGKLQSARAKRSQS